MGERDPLATILVERELLPAAEVARWEARAAADNCFLEQILEREQVLTRAQLREILENHFFCPAVDLSGWSYDPAVLRLVPHKLAQRHLVFPVAGDAQSLTVAFGDPDNVSARRAVSQMLLMPVTRVVALRPEI